MMIGNFPPNHPCNKDNFDHHIHLLYIQFAIHHNLLHNPLCSTKKSNHNMTNNALNSTLSHNCSMFFNGSLELEPESQ